MRQKQFKVRIENTESGEVEEIETNCISIISIREATDDEAEFNATLRFYQNSTNRCGLAMVKALESQKNNIEKKLANGFFHHFFGSFRTEADE